MSRVVLVLVLAIIFGVIACFNPLIELLADALRALFGL